MDRRRSSGGTRGTEAALCGVPQRAVAGAHAAVAARGARARGGARGGQPEPIHHELAGQRGPLARPRGRPQCCARAAWRARASPRRVVGQRAAARADRTPGGGAAGARCRSRLAGDTCRVSGRDLQVAVCDQLAVAMTRARAIAGPDVPVIGARSEDPLAAAESPARAQLEPVEARPGAEDLAPLAEELD